MSGRFGKMATDANEKYWSYQPGSETPSLEEAIRIGAIHPDTTTEKWQQLSPGMRREIVRSAKKANEKAKGTP